MANSVITSEAILKDDPDLVKHFLAALLTGWEDAMAPANEKKVLAALKTLDSGNTDEIRQQQLAATRSLVKPSGSIKIGTIDVTAWKQTETIMIQQGQIKKPVHIETRLIPLK